MMLGCPPAPHVLQAEVSPAACRAPISALDVHAASCAGGRAAAQRARLRAPRLVRCSAEHASLASGGSRFGGAT